MKKIEKAIKPFLKKEIPDIHPGDTVKVFQKLKEKDKERIQVFEGVVIARKHRKEVGATITVRRIVGGIGVERIFPLYSPTIEKIEIVKRSKTRRAKLYYLRKAKGKRARLKRKEFAEAVAEEKKPPIEEEGEKPAYAEASAGKEESTEEEPQGKQNETKKNSKN